MKSSLRLAPWYKDDGDDNGDDGQRKKQLFGIECGMMLQQGPMIM